MRSTVWPLLERWSIRAFLVMVWPCCQILVAQEPAKTGSPLAKGTLSGTVVGPNDKPIANVRVWANNYGDKLLAEA